MQIYDRWPEDSGKNFGRAVPSGPGAPNLCTSNRQNRLTLKILTKSYRIVTSFLRTNLIKGAHPIPTVFKKIF